MAFYTTVSQLDVNRLLSTYGLPALKDLQGAPDGIENSTYFLMLIDNSQYVLTLFEKHSAHELTPYIQLTAYLHEQNLPVPTPLVNQQGLSVHTLSNKPAVLMPRAIGKHCETPSLSQCAHLGEVLARCHLATENLSLNLPNAYNMAWLKKTAQEVLPQLNTSEQALLKSQLTQAEHLQQQELPRGIIHGDCFKDNVFVSGEKISALIDFNDAGEDFLILDLAIAINDWCFTDDNQLLLGQQQAMISAYQQQRPFSSIEERYWSGCLQLAATRFWVSRLDASPPSSRQKLKKDPLQYKKRLLARIKIPANDN